jgi:hypothetical protein
LTTCFKGALAFTGALALTTGFVLLDLTAFVAAFGLEATFDLEGAGFDLVATAFLAFVATGLAFGFDLEAGLLTVLAFAAGFGAAFLDAAVFEDLAFDGAVLDDLLF